MADVSRDQFAVVEERGWPLLTVRLPAAISPEGMQAFVDAIERAYARRERFVVVVDAAPVAEGDALYTQLTVPRRAAGA